MTEKLLPAEFRSGNDIPVERATITRDRMIEILESVTKIAQPTASAEPAARNDESFWLLRLKQYIQKAAFAASGDKHSALMCCEEIHRQLQKKAIVAAQPSVPDEWLSDQYGDEFDGMTAGQGYRKGWNDCRAAMIATAPTPPADGQNPHRQGRCAQCNKRGEDGWALYCVECSGKAADGQAQQDADNHRQTGGENEI